MSADRTRSNQLRRAIAACRLLATEWLTLETLGERLGCHARTARRYLYALQVAGVDVEARDAGAAKVYRLDRRAWLAVLDLPQD